MSVSSSARRIFVVMRQSRPSVSVQDPGEDAGPAPKE
jgi:hypothetical protein